jgi:hypothetical protein
MEPRHKRRRYLIDRSFQLRWTLVITLAGGLTAALMSTLLWLSIDRQNALLERAMEMDARLQKESKDVIVLLLNMPGTTPAEAKKHKQRFEEVSRRFETSTRVKAELAQRNRALRYWLVGFVLLLSGGLFVWGIFLTHRVAGPLFVIRRHLDAFLADGVVEPRPLRKGDQLQDLYGAVCEALGRRSPPRDRGESGPTP